MATHACSACRKDKPLAEFKKWRDGDKRASWWCDVCRPIRQAAATIKRRSTPEGRERDRVISRRWKEQHREANRARDRAAMHRPCPNCGGPMGRQNSQCRGCRKASVEARRSIIEGLWRDGRSLAEIAEEIGTNVNSLGATMVAMRREGWDLPYRYAVANGKRVAA